MTLDEWIEKMPTRPLRTGISITLRLDINGDGNGHLVCPDDPALSLPVEKRGVLRALRQLWQHGTKEAAARSVFRE